MMKDNTNKLKELKQHEEVDEKRVEEFVRLGKITDVEKTLSWLQEGVDIETAMKVTALPCSIPNDIAEAISKLRFQNISQYISLSGCEEVTCSLCDNTLFKFPCSDFTTFLSTTGSEWMVWGDVSEAENRFTHDAGWMTVRYIDDVTNLNRVFVETNSQRENVICGVCTENGTGMSIRDIAPDKYVRGFDAKRSRVTQFSQIVGTTVMRDDWYLLNEQQQNSNRSRSLKGNEWNEVSDVIPFGGEYSTELYEVFAGEGNESLREYLHRHGWTVVQPDDVIAYSEEMHELLGGVEESIDFRLILSDDETINSVGHRDRVEREMRNNIKRMMGEWGGKTTGVVDCRYVVNKGKEIWCDAEDKYRVLDEMLMWVFEEVGMNDESLTIEKMINEEETPGTSEVVVEKYKRAVSGEGGK
jgi:hypothetical protein